MAGEGCREFSGEIVDDSLKEMFSAVERYRYHGTKSTAHNRGAAIAMLGAQINDRLPVIVQKASDECRPAKPCIDPEPIARDLEALRQDMVNKVPYAKVYDKALAIDKKYALAAYYSFCSCNRV